MSASGPTILLTGAGGQLGRELAAALASCGTLLACDRRALDLTDARAIARVVRDGFLQPSQRVGPVAKTGVDHGERWRIDIALLRARQQRVSDASGLRGVARRA